ncbi:AAA family ATPase [Bradyrhizobium sp. AZCC 2289]|uniref:AAA family ATPase n=1 Tax=Bradyrhizobium sp. AZCC 2289 TaxID=3117026 RepID=UPI002FF346B8
MMPAPTEPLTFPPLAALTPAAANSEYAKARHCLAGRDPDDGLRALVTLTQRLTRVQLNGFLVDKDIPEHLWTAAELSGIVDHHGPDTVQNIMASAIEAATADPGEKTSSVAESASGSISATPYAWRQPETIPRRDWLYGHLLVRKFLSATVAPGGVGKSALVTAETLAMVSGKPLLGVVVTRPMRAWLWNLEDPQEETARRIQAGALHYRLSADDIGDRLFVDSGRDQRLVVATATRNGAVIVRPVVDGLIAEIIARRIDVIVIDPFVSCHEASENDNGAMDMIAKEWARVADAGNCAVHLIHHTRKLGSNETEVTVESSRGAKALTDACRSVRAINRMSEKEAQDSGADNPRLYFRAFNDKSNLAPPADRSDWFKIESVQLGNGPQGHGDSVGVVTPWEWPSAFGGVTTDDLFRVQKAIAAGAWRQSPTANGWAGSAVADVLGLDLTDQAAKAKVKSLLRTWIENKALKVVQRPDESRHDRPFIEVDQWANC